MLSPRIFIAAALAAFPLASGFLFRATTSNKFNRRETTHLFDHSSATIFQVGDAVTVTEDVMKAGRNLRGLSGEVVETWEKCDVDPTCCCAELVDDGLCVRVKFAADDKNELFANDTFSHYFAESELVKNRRVDNDKEDDGEVEGRDGRSSPPVAFDGLSCTAFKLDKLKMGEQAKRIAAFQQSRHYQVNE